MFAIAGVALFTLTCILGLVLIEERKTKLNNRPLALIPEKLFQERRSHKRIPIELRIPYQLIQSKKANRLGANSNNISAAGIGIKLPEKLKLGTQIRLFMPADITKDKKPSKIIGEVIWVKEETAEDDGRRIFKTGIKFLSPLKENL